MASSNKQMLFIIFTEEGIQEAEQDILSEQAELWVNPDLIDADCLNRFKTHNIVINALPEQVDATREKSVLAALAYVEKQAPGKEILIEYI